MAEEFGTYTIPVILSFRDVTGQVNKEMGGSAKAAGADFGKDFGQAVRKASEADIKKSAEAYGKLYDKAADSSGKFRAEQAKLNDLIAKGTTGGARYIAQWERVEKAKRDEARAVRTASDAYKQYERAIKDASDAADSLDSAGGGFLDKIKGLGSNAKSSGVESATGFVEGFGGPIASLGTKAGPIGLALAATVGLGVAAGGALASQVLAGMEREVGRDKIQAQLGLDDKQAAQLGQSSGQIYAQNFGESTSDVSEAMADVVSTFGKGAAPQVIEDMTKKALTFRDVFGTDVSESVANVQNLIVNGLASNGSEAFDLMTAAFQRVPAAMRDELPEILNEYSTYFQTLGFSGEEAFGLLVKTAPQGKIALDKVGDSLKEFTLLATDVGAKPVQDALASLGLVGTDVANNLLAGGPAAQAQFDQVVNGLLRIKDPAQQAQTAIALFGTPLEDLDKSKIPQFLEGLSNADTAMQGFSGSAQNMVDTVGDNAAGSLESAKRSIETAVNGMQDSLATAFGPYVKDFANEITEHKDDITAFLSDVGSAATAMASLMTVQIGGVVKVFGVLQSATGDAIGFMLDSFEQMANGAASFFDIIPGMDGVADKARNAAVDLSQMSDKMHDAGEGTQRFGEEIINAGQGLFDVSGKLHDTAEGARAASDRANQLAATIGALPNAKSIDISAIVVYKDTAGQVIPPDQLRTPVRSADAPRIGGGRADGGSIIGPGGPKSDIIPIWASNGEHMLDAEDVGLMGGQMGVYRFRSMLKAGAFGKFKSGGAIDDAGLNPGAAFLRQQIFQMWPQIKTIGGRRSEDGFGEHSSGNAIDVMIPNYGTPEGKALGDQIAAFVVANKDALGLNGMIWRQTSFGYGGSFDSGKPMKSRGSDTQNHMDHLHLILGSGRGGSAAAVDLPTSSLTLPDGGSVSPAGVYSGGGSGGNSSGSGSGTAGYGPNGEAGYYTPSDPRDIKEAEGKIAEADAKVRELEAKQRELEADAKESERISAQNDVDKAKNDAAKAREDLDELKKGKFTASKDGGSSSSSKNQGGPGLGELGSIGSSFLKETFGIDGSWLPDISNLGPVKMIDTLLGSLIPNPGGDAGVSPTGTTSSSPFGIPDVVAPGAPQPHLSGPGGMPAAPGPVVNIDQSQNFNNSPLGWDPQQVERNRQKTQDRRALPRLSGIGMGAGN
ncbi:hypothetical protein EB72_24820 [Mycobacterium sp. SWH-M1]|nr:hypothetical protein EB72_24820 [Mycobacterium sp. SWH-M1]